MFAGYFSRHALLPDRLLYATPRTLGREDAEEVVFWARRKLELRGWLFRGERRGVIVCCPGNSGNASAHLEYWRLLLATGHSVLTFDYQGFGRSAGRPDLRSLVPDTAAACELAAFRTGEPVGLFGLSLGASAALAAATRGLHAVRGVAVEGASDFGAMMRGLLTEGFFGPLRYTRIEGPSGVELGREPLGLAPLARCRSLGLLSARIASAFYPFEGKSLSRLAGRLGQLPVLLVHGVEDRLLPCEAAIDLQGELRERARLWLIPGVGHAQEPILAAFSQYAAQLASFFGEAFEGGLRPAPAARLLEIHAHQPVHGAVAATIGLEEVAGLEPAEEVLLTAAGGNALRQALLRKGGKATFEFPGPIDTLATLRLLPTAPDERAARYTGLGYRSSFRRLVSASNARNLSELLSALEDHYLLPRENTPDFVAALYALRGAQAALGRVSFWKADDPARGRRFLELLLLLWESDPARPSREVADSPAAWGARELARLGDEGEPNEQPDEERSPT